MSKIPTDEPEELKEDFLSKNFWGKNVAVQLDSWLSFYYKFGRFPGSQKLISIPKVNVPVFLKTDLPISPVNLYNKFTETDAKGLVSIHASAALNIHFGGNKYISQAAIGEYLQNLTDQALSQENDEMFMSFNNIGLLVKDLLEQFAIKENEEITKALAISKEIRNKLETDFEINLSLEMQIQIGEEEEEIETEPKPTEFSTQLKIEEINEIYNREKEDYLRTALKINEIDLEAAEVADADNEAIIDEIINPTPGLVVDNDINVDTQFDFQNSDLDTSFTLSNTLQERIDDILENARKKFSSFKFPGEATEDVPNDPLYPFSQIKTEDIYIDDSLRDMLYPGDPLYFPQPSTDNKRDFELNVTGDGMIILKSPALTFATIEKKDLKNVLNKIMEDLKLNI